MKVLIAYDGSTCSDAAIMDLRRAGLPKKAEVLVLSVAEAFMPVATVPYGALVAGPGMFIPDSLETECSTNEHLEEAKAFAQHAAERLHGDFPGWDITTETWLDAAGPAIIRKARAWKPDVLVMGSHGRSGISRFVLGSVSEHVLHHVNCTVRISRHHLHSQDRAIRLLIGVDGSLDSKLAVEAVAARSWPEGTEALAFGVLDSRISLSAANTLEGAVPVVIEDECCRKMTSAVEEAEACLCKADLQGSHQVVEGKPVDALLEEAEKWAADCVFVGAKGMTGIERLLLGSVSTALAARATCSVEVVRPRIA